MTPEEIESHRYWSNATRESMLAYWNSLLAVNGILIAVFAVVAITNIANRWISLITLLVSFVNSGVLVQNFREVISVYRELNDINPDQFDKMSGEETEYRLHQTNLKHQVILNRENVVTGLLVAQATLIVLLLLVKFATG